MSARPRLFEPEVTGAQLVHQLENAPAPACYAGKRVIGHDDGQTGLLGEEFVDVTQQRATAREDNASLGDVRAEFRRGLLQRLFHGADDALPGLLQRFQNLVAVQREAARYALGEVASLHGELAHLLARISGADLDLDALSGRLADQDAVVAPHVVHDRLVEAIAANA